VYHKNWYQTEMRQCNIKAIENTIIYNGITY
jgi:hypothetical protein